MAEKGECPGNTELAKVAEESKVFASGEASECNEVSTEVLE